MFQIKDIVLYGSEGIHQIEEIRQMDFKGEPTDYYVLKSVMNKNAAVFVPAANKELMAKMRRVLSAEEIRAMIRSMPDEEPIWIDDENDRIRIYKDIILKGDHRDIVKVIKALYEHRTEQRKIGKNLHKADERFLKDAEKMINEEIAYVLQIKPEQVVTFIREQMERNA